MAEKKGFFSFLKSWTTASDEEDTQDVSSPKGSSSREKRGNKPRRDRDEQNEQNRVTDEIETYCVEQLGRILERSGFDGTVRVTEREGSRLDLEIHDAEEDAGRIIGKNGSTLSSLEQLIKSFVFRQFKAYIKVVIDAGEYRKRRFEQLKTKAFKAAETVGKTGRKIALEPMSATERREIHMLFEEDEDVTTLSEGRGDYRRVVLVRRTKTAA